MKRMLLIINPCSGQRKAKKHLLEVVEIFNRANYDVQVYITASPGDGEKAAMRYAEEVDLVVCCGGDGTFNETVSGVLKSGVEVPIGYIPAGSTNDFATSLGLNTDLLQAARDITGEHFRRLDVGEFAGRYFSYVASFGAFTRATYTTPQSAKNILGHAAYMLSGIQEISQLRPYPIRITLSDGTVIAGDYLFGAISNSTSMGGVLTLDPEQVNMSDGRLELLLIRTPKDLFELRECVRALQQKVYNCGMITFVNADSMLVEAPENMAWTLDGEQENGHSSIPVRCLHRAITVCTGEKTE